MTIPFADKESYRKLPVYLLLDCSSSMQGTKIVQVNEGAALVHQGLQGDPRSLDTVRMCAITAYKLDPVPVKNFTPPSLTANGETALGEALALLLTSLDIEVLKNLPGQKDDYKPLVFLLTDGQPTDSWQAQAREVRQRIKARMLNVIALAIGDDADRDVLREITDIVLALPVVKSDDIIKYFEWLTVGIIKTSQSYHIEEKSVQGQLPEMEMPALPPGIIKISL
jgi:uncharacterized protein YegL